MSENKRKIEDYLHLYLGCDCFDLYNNKSCKLIAVYSNGQVEVLHKTNWKLSSKEIKLILRPLSDMTEDEAEYFAWMCMDSKHHFDEDCRIDQDEIQIELVPYDGGNLLDADIEIYIGVSCRCFEGSVIIRKDGSISVEDENGKKGGPIDDVAEKVRYLLSKHFDLFGLIDAGLAIDATKINQTNSTT